MWRSEVQFLFKWHVSVCHCVVEYHVELFVIASLDWNGDVQVKQVTITSKLTEFQGFIVFVDKHRRGISKELNMRIIAMGQVVEGHVVTVIISILGLETPNQTWHVHYWLSEKTRSYPEA